MCVALTTGMQHMLRSQHPSMLLQRTSRTLCVSLCGSDAEAPVGTCSGRAGRQGSSATPSTHSNYAIPLMAMQRGVCSAATHSHIAHCHNCRLPEQYVCSMTAMLLQQSCTVRHQHPPTNQLKNQSAMHPPSSPPGQLASS
jgi:hypothetical protein